MRAAAPFALFLVVGVFVAGCLDNGSVNDGTETVANEADPLVRPRTVIAVLEFAGTNPYHRDFQRPAQTEHPSTYVVGYPDDAVALNLTLDAPDYGAAVAADNDTWAGYQAATLHYVPGTNIIGMISFAEGLTGLDEGGHGVGTTSLVAGTMHGAAPDADLVVVNGDLFAALRWIAGQPWIDAVSISLGAFLGTCTVGVCDPVDICTGNPYLPVSLANSTRLIHNRGGQSFTAASYGCGFRVGSVGSSWPGVSSTSFFSGPSWVMTIGTYLSATEQGDFDGAHPVELLSPATGYKAAEAKTLDGEVWFGNASGAVPKSAGLFAALVLRARELLGDLAVVHAPGVVAVAAPGTPLPEIGPLADGVFTQTEAEALFFHTAWPVDALESYAAHGGDPAVWLSDTMPAPPFAEFLVQGYGLLTNASLPQGYAVLDGTKVAPKRPVEDAWHVATERFRDLFWVPVDTLGAYPL